MGRLFDLQIDFFRPLWRRVLLVLFCVVWAVVEFVMMAPFWGVIFAGMGALAFWQFFLDDWPAETEPSGAPDSPNDAAARREAHQDASEGNEH